jgi:hypothetical protein
MFALANDGCRPSGRTRLSRSADALASRSSAVEAKRAPIVSIIYIAWQM